MQTNEETPGAMPSLNDIISSGNQVQPNQVSYQKITTTQTYQPGSQIQSNQTITRKVQEEGNLHPVQTTTTTVYEQPETTTKITRKVVTTQQPVTETSYYSKKVTTTRGGQGPTTTSTVTNTKYSKAGTTVPTTSQVSQVSTYTRPSPQPNKGTTTMTTTNTIQSRQYGQNRPGATTTSEVYRGKDKTVKPPTKVTSSQSYSGNRYQPKRPEPATYKPKARSPEPGKYKIKTINRGRPVENIQITHIIYSSRPGEFHITENLNLDNLNTDPIHISKADRAKLQKSGKVTASCSCDGVEIAKPKKVNLKGNTIHYQHAQGIGMTNDSKENINPKYYFSEIKTLSPIHRQKGEGKLEHVENFRSQGKPSNNSVSKIKTTTKTTTSYTRDQNYNQNYRSGTTNPRGGMTNSSSTRTGNVNSSSTYNRGQVGNNTRSKYNYNNRGTNNELGNGEIIKDTKTKVQIGSRSYKSDNKPTTYTTSERKVYNQESFFNKQE